MPIILENLKIGHSYGRPYLANIWNYKSYCAISRGIVISKNDNRIVLFITKQKQQSAVQYRDYIDDGILHMDGETNHQNDERIINSLSSDDKIVLFYREIHHTDFIYYGQVKLINYEVNYGDLPSRFVFKLIQYINT